MRSPHEHHRAFRGDLGRAKGGAGEPYACANIPHEKRTRNNKKKAKTNKFVVVKKVAKNEKTGKQQKNINNKKEKAKKRQIKKNSTKQKFPQAS